MRLAGRKLEGANEEIIVIPRGDGDDIVFKAQAILSFEDFDRLCPMPRPPVRILKGGERSLNVEDPTFQIAVQEHGVRRSAWMVLTSLRLGTPELEWDRVDFSNPDSWPGYIDELRDSGFSEVEIVRVMRGCMIANALDDEKLDEARQRFLCGAANRRAADLSCHPGVVSNTESGERAPDSV